MIKIQKSRFGFWVQYIAKNGEILANSEMFKSKQSAMKNIKAVAGVFNFSTDETITIIDCTGKTEKTITI